MRSCRVLHVALALLIALPACGNFARRGSAVPIPTISPTSYGTNQKLPPITTFDDFKKKRKGVLRVQLLDDRNRPLPGASIRYKGAKSGSAVTDERGVVEILLEPGGYKVDVAPCGPAVVTNDYESAIASVVAGGRPTSGRLTGIRWDRRFHPVPSVEYSDNPPWRVGTPVRGSIRVEDRCPDNFGIAPGVSMTAYAWTASSNFRFTAKPVMKSNEDGMLAIDFRCAARGNGYIRIYDPGGKVEPINILTAGSGPEDGKAYCRS